MKYTLAKLHKPKTGNDWYAYYTYRHPITEKVTQFKERAGINRIKNLTERKREGMILVSSLNADLINGWSPFELSEAEKHISTPIVELFQEYLKTKETNIRARSYEHYTYALHLLAQYLESMKATNLKCTSFTKAMAFGYSDWLLGTKRYSGKSHNNQVSNMKMFFQMMEDRDVIPKNPFKLIKRRPEERGRLVCYSEVQKKEIKTYTQEKGLPMFMFIQWIYYCFVRPNEIMGLQVKHIDFEFKRIQIPANISKNRKQSSVDIPEVFFKVVKEKYEKLDAESFLFSKGLKPGLVRLRRKEGTVAHKKIVDALGIKGLTLYDWKHKGASDFLLEGNNPYELMVRMRHHSLEQTMTYLRSLGVSMFDKSKKTKHEF